MILTNAFSLNMVAAEDFLVRCSHLDQLKVIELLRATGVDSAVGHTDTAAVLTHMLGIMVVANRRNLSLRSGDRAIVAQYCGPRMPEGATKLPEGSRIKWMLIEIC